MTPSQHAALEQVSKEFVETLLAKEVCLSDAECTIVRDAAISLLSTQRVAGLEEVSEEAITAAMRESDRCFEKVGGSTRHYVRDCLLPIMKKHGLIVVRNKAQELRP